jgi:ribosomal protein L11 methyltransferase
MMWFQLSITALKTGEIEYLSELLESFGALSITLQDNKDHPILEPELGSMPLWPDTAIVALFSEAKVAEEARVQLQHLRTDLNCEIEVLADKDWERAWMDEFKPMCFGERFWIYPSFSRPDPNTLHLILDPGLAFGSGTHATTALCLNWLASAALQHCVLIDYGCGSGILGLSALKLGADKVLAVDLDPQALDATKNNALLNTISEQQLTIGLPELLENMPKADYLIANILLQPLIQLKEQFKQYLKPDGQLVVSGILSDQATVLINAYRPLFTQIKEVHREGWCLLVFHNETLSESPRL